MKIVFFNRSIMSGGIEKCIETLLHYIHQTNEIEIVYTNDDKLDPHIVSILERYAKVTRLDEKIITCDICIFCYIYFDFNKIMKQIRAKKYFCWIHSKPRELEFCLLDNKAFVNKVSEFICVSEEVKKSLNIEKQGIVIHNFINNNIQELANEKNPYRNEEKLKLLVVSRLSKGKGFERLLKLVNELEKENINYKLDIIGKGRAKEREIKEWFSKFSNVMFLGYKDNPYCYMKNADYLIQLSDYETWGNVITEAKALHTPCIVTDFPSVIEQIEDGKNGIIVKRDENDYNKVVKRVLKEKNDLKRNLTNFVYQNEIEEWKKILEKYII